MSSPRYLLLNVKSTEKYFYQIGGPILIFFGTIGCILNSIVFTQKNLRKNPCSIYFLAFNAANLLYIWSSILPLTLSLGYNIDASARILAICRIRLYTTILSNCWSAFYLILASIDRVLITSASARIRQRSTCRFAYISLAIGIPFWTLFHVHALIATAIVQVAPRTFICYFQSGFYLAFISYYALIKEVSTLFLLIICGLWSIKNIRKSAQRIAPSVHSSVTASVATRTLRSNSSKDHQFILMLVMDIIFYVSFSLMFAFFLIYQQITQNEMKTIERTQIENSVRNFCLFGVGISFASSFYANLSISKTFRTELKKIVLTIIRSLH